MGTYIWTYTILLTEELLLRLKRNLLLFLIWLSSEDYGS